MSIWRGLPVDNVADRRLYDITPRISPRLAVFPGDTAFSRAVLLSMADGANIDLSSMTTTLHLGAHADAPSHYTPHGVSIADRDPRRYLGRCQVVSVPDTRGRRVTVDDLREPVMAPRVLFFTHSFPAPEQWNGDFASLSPELIAHLHDDCGVSLVGIDTPSVDPETDRDLPSHAALAARDMAVLEGLVLHDVPPGIYTLIALPLPIEGGDASPLRAVLLEGDWGLDALALAGS